MLVPHFLSNVILACIAVSGGSITATASFAAPLGAVGVPLHLGAALAIGYGVTIWRTYRAVPLATDSGQQITTASA